MLYLSGKVYGDLPAMVTPRMRQKPPREQLWAADTGCFLHPEEFHFGTYLRWLNELAADDHAERCLFATAPDAYGDWHATLSQAGTLPFIRDVGYRAAFVIQPGQTDRWMPWADMDALFVGGPDAWQRSDAVRELVAGAHARDMWVHVGRVNSARRLTWAEALGADSADGTVLRYDQSRPVESWVDAVNASPSLSAYMQRQARNGHEEDL